MPDKNSATLGSANRNTSKKRHSNASGNGGRIKLTSNTLYVILLFITCLTVAMNVSRHHLQLSPHLSSMKKSSHHSKSLENFKNGRMSSPQKKRKILAQNPVTHGHDLSKLSCDKHGGPAALSPVIDEMIYWSDIPSDSTYKSPFYDPNKYLTFEPDPGGWNNIRMAMETVLTMAHAMGRTLVLPPESKMYLLTNKGEKDQKNEFTFNDFFHLDSLSMEHAGLDIITMEDFLERVATKGKLSNPNGDVMGPPNGRTDWNGESKQQLKLGLFEYLRTVGEVRLWKDRECMLAFPSGKEGNSRLQSMMDEINEILPKIHPLDYEGKPIPVNAEPIERLKESLADRTELCLYDEIQQSATLVHFKTDPKEHVRLLTHFYSFIYFEDWRQDLWVKRFIRDHVRYVDELQCAAARIVAAIRQKALENDKDSNGQFDTFHIRRGDFQYKKTRVDADVIYERSKDQLKEGSTVYIATDERDKNFFKPMTDRYNVLFLDDFMPEINDLNTNFYGMLDQVICTKGHVFFGTWFSTFSGFINRMRGYYISKHDLEGSEDGTMQSYYIAPEDKKDEMRTYWPVRLPFYMREFPTGWRNIDLGIDELWEGGEFVHVADK